MRARLAGGISKSAPCPGDAAAFGGGPVLYSGGAAILLLRSVVVDDVGAEG